MALTRFAVKHYGHLTRRPNSATAAQAVGYITRADEPVMHREDLIHAEAQNLPAWAGNDPRAFFVAAEKHERANGRIYTIWEMSLPRELTQEQQLETTRAFLGAHLGKHVYVWAMHESPASDGGTNPHVHVLFSHRTLDGIERGPEQFFRRYNPEHPEQGGARKDPDFSKQSMVYAMRQAWTDTVNTYLEHYKQEVRLDPRSYVEQGIALTPEEQLRPSAIRKVIHRGEHHEAWDRVVAAREERRELRIPSFEEAHAFWQERRTALHIPEGATPAVAIPYIQKARAEAIQTAPPQESPEVRLATLKHEEQVLTVASTEADKKATHLTALKEEATDSMEKKAVIGIGLAATIHRAMRDFDGDIHQGAKIEQGYGPDI